MKELINNDIKWAEWHDLGNAAMNHGLDDLARRLYNHAVESVQSDVELLHTLSSVAISKLKHRKELPWCIDILGRKALSDGKNLANWINLSTAYLKVPDPDMAIMAADKALEIDRDNPDAHCNKATALGMLGDYDEEFICLSMACGKDSSRNWQKAMVERKVDHDSSALSWLGFYGDYGYRPKPIVGPLLKPIDLSSPSTALICVEQGLGDLIMMTRAIKWLEANGFSPAVYTTDQNIHDFCIDVLDINCTMDNAACQYYAYCVNLMDLLLYKWIWADENSILYPYISPPFRRDFDHSRLMNAEWDGKIGVNFTGNPKFEYEYTRGVYNENIRTAIMDILGDSAFDLNDHRNTSLQEFAEKFGGLDGVVTTDTMTAHLAGAMGIPCLVLLSVNHDWRWFYRWYGSEFQTVTQDKVMSWASVLPAVEEFKKRIA